MNNPLSDLSNFRFEPVLGTINANSASLNTSVRVANLPDYIRSDEQVALGNLFAAAPKLLADLRFVREWFTENGLTETYYAICEHLDEAITEAWRPA